MALTDDDVREILRIIDDSDLNELSIETEGFSLQVSKGGPAGGDAPPRAPRGVSGARGGASPAAEPPPIAKPAKTDGLTTIASPMLGIFYRAESPGAAAFVEVGARVEPDTTVCIIEVMKMMNSVPAGVAGTVTEIVAENAELVEFGQPLFRVAPDA